MKKDVYADACDLALNLATKIYLDGIPNFIHSLNVGEYTFYKDEIIVRGVVIHERNKEQ